MSARIAVITGAGSGIGRATAIALSKKGTRVVLNGRNIAKLEKVRAAIGEMSGCIIVPGDVADSAVPAACMNAGREAWGEWPDIFIASAGKGMPGTVTNSDPALWDELIDTNIKGLMHQLRAVAGQMLQLAGDGRDFVMSPLDIVVIGSTIGRNVSPFNSVYGATKFAAHGLTEALRRQLGPQGIRVSLLEPGLVKTDFQKTAGYDLEWFEGYAREVGPVLTAEDVANVIAFLVDLPGNVHLDNISIRPTRQAYP